MNLRITIVQFFLIASFSVFGQTAPDFTITDTKGNQHSLYADYLDQGKVVLIDFFFVDCPPCNAFAPHLQTLYEDWGSGNGDVQFMSLTSKDWDSNADVSGYESQHGLTMPGAGEDGGGYDAYLAFKNGGFGSIFGSPFFLVISSDGTMQWDVDGSGTNGRIEAINTAITEALNPTIDPEPEPDPVSVTLDVLDTKGNAIDGLQLFITSLSEGEPKYPLNLNQSNQFTFQYFSEEYPDIDDPIIIFEKTGDYLNGVFTTDILFIQRHLLLISPFEHEYQFQAADVSRDGNITAFDMSIIRKTILEQIDAFPSGVSWIFEPEYIELDTTSGGTLDLSVQGIKIGDLNRH